MACRGSDGGVFASLVGIVFAVAAFPNAWLKVLGLLTCAVAGALMMQEARDRDKGKLSNAMLAWLSVTGVVVLLLVISFAAQSGQPPASDRAAAESSSTSSPEPVAPSTTSTTTTQPTTSQPVPDPEEPETSYRDKLIKFSPPDCSYGIGTWPVDFDKPAVNEKWADLQYNCESYDGGGLIESEDALNFADAPAGAVTATTCQDAARTTGHVSVNVTDVVAKKSAWCVITHSGQVAWSGSPPKARRSLNTGNNPRSRCS